MKRTFTVTFAIRLQEGHETELRQIAQAQALREFAGADPTELLDEARSTLSDAVHMLVDPGSLQGPLTIDECSVEETTTGYGGGAANASDEHGAEAAPEEETHDINLHKSEDAR